MDLPVALYVDAAAQLSLARRLDSLAHNLANSSTPGFLREGLQFESTLSTTGGANVAFPTAKSDYISRARGAVHRTGSTTDLAIRGDAWLSLQTPDGAAYTRDGRLQVDPSGAVRSVNGYPVLDDGGAPLTLDPSGGNMSIAPDGAVSQRGRNIGVIGLVTLDPDARLTRYGNSAVRVDRATTPVTNFSSTGVMQGFLENGNAEPMLEMSRLIEIQRNFDHVSACMNMSDSAQQEAIRTLGGQA